MKILGKIITSWPVQLLGAVCCFYISLMMFGVIPGMEPALLSKVFGVGFFLAGLSTLARLFSPNSGLPSAEGMSDDDVKALMKEGSKGQAIKLYRAIHHVGLREARESVEKLEIYHALSLPYRAKEGGALEED